MVRPQNNSGTLRFCVGGDKLKSHPFAETIFRAASRQNGRHLGASCTQQAFIDDHAPVCTATQDAEIDRMFAQAPAAASCTSVFGSMRLGQLPSGSAMCSCVRGIPQPAVRHAQQTGSLVCRSHASLAYSLAQFMSGCGVAEHCMCCCCSSCCPGICALLLPLLILVLTTVAASAQSITKRVSISSRTWIP